MGLSVGPYGDPRGVGVCFERGASVCPSSRLPRSHGSGPEIKREDENEIEIETEFDVEIEFKTVMEPEIVT